MLSFTTTLKTDTFNFTARFIELPPDIAAALGAKSKMRVKGTLNGVPFQNSLVKTETSFVFPMKQSLREATGVNVGDTVIVTIEQNFEDRPPLPEDVATALAGNPALQAAWNRLPPSHQRKHLDHINEAKQAETRARRIEKMVATLKG
jgi:hypothetical protein